MVTKRNPRKNSQVPEELQGAATTSEVNAVEERLKEKLDRCYTADKYEDFQTAVETIIVRAVEHSDCKTKIKPFIDETVKQFLYEKGWKNKTFWIPTAISLIAAVAAIAALFK